MRGGEVPQVSCIWDDTRRVRAHAALWNADERGSMGPQRLPNPARRERDPCPVPFCPAPGELLRSEQLETDQQEVKAGGKIRGFARGQLAVSVS